MTVKRGEVKTSYEFRLKEKITGNYGETIKSSGTVVFSINEEKYEKLWKHAYEMDQVTKIAVAHGMWASIKHKDCDIYKVTTTIKREKWTT